MDIKPLAAGALHNLKTIRRCRLQIMGLEYTIQKYKAEIRQLDDARASWKKDLGVLRGLRRQMEGKFSAVNNPGGLVSSAMYALENVYRELGNIPVATEVNAIAWRDSRPGGRINKDHNFAGLNEREAALVREAVDLAIKSLEERITNSGTEVREKQISEALQFKAQEESVLNRTLSDQMSIIKALNELELEMFQREYGHEFKNSEEDLMKLFDLRVRTYGLENYDTDMILRTTLPSASGKLPLADTRDCRIPEYFRNLLMGDFYLVTGLFLRPVGETSIKMLHYDHYSPLGEILQSGEFRPKG